MDTMKKISILIADDNVDTCFILKEYFDMQDDMYICAIVGNGNDALAKAQELKPDVMILDVIMPLNDGIYVLEQLHSSSCDDLPIILLTSASEQDFITRNSKAFGVDYFLLKPYSLDVLHKRIKMLLNDKKGNIIKPYRNNDIYRFIIELGVPTHLLAYKYMSRALEILLSQTTACAIGKNVYAVIAKENGTTENCVERAIRQCVLRITEISTDTFKAVVGFNGEFKVKSLTSSQLLKQAAEYIKLQDIL